MTALRMKSQGVYGERVSYSAQTDAFKKTFSIPKNFRFVRLVFRRVLPLGSTLTWSFKND